ncbi:MAG: carboxypeptidase regulatory-like domain-containing protein [Candidatus Margulisiibacteriota bacterium]
MSSQSEITKLSDNSGVIIKKMGKMKNVKLFLSITFVVLLSSKLVSATNYYVSTTGKDSNTGISEAQAWRTIQYAANSVSAGDTVQVSSGTYNEQVAISRSGTAGNPIAFLGEGMPTITWTGSWYGDCPVEITGSYITITGFNIIAYDTVYDGSKVAGIFVKWDSGAKNLNISNNYIRTQSGPGILLMDDAGSYSVINNNEIHTGHQTGIWMDRVFSVPITHLSITNNTIYVDENKQHRDDTDASGIHTSNFAANFTVSYNKILHAGYTGIKVGGSGHTIAYNEVGPDGYVHNAIEILPGDSTFIGNVVNGINLTWATQWNQFYSAGVAQAHRKNLIIRDNTVTNGRGRALTIGGLEHHFIVENFTAKNFRGRAIQLGDVEEDLYPWPVRVTGNGIFYNISLEVNDTNNDYPVDIISLGEATSSNHADWTAYKAADVTFIDMSITGNYALTTWLLDTKVVSLSNAHFEGTIYVINSNKNDVGFDKQPSGTLNGAIIFYYYTDVQVVDSNGNPVEGAKVAFICNVPSIKAKNTNYKYVPFPDGKTQDIDFTYTEANGHTPLPSNASSTVAITDFKQTITGKTYYTWTITAERDGYINSTTVNPDSSWYRADPNVYQNTITIVLPFSQTFGNISGTVTDTGGSPVPNVTVTDSVKTATTDALGKYTLALVLTGARNITAFKTGYQSSTKQVNVVEGSTVSLDFQLSPASTDTTPSLISGVSSTPGNSSAVINWMTDEPATSLVKYGLQSGNYTEQLTDTNLKVNHSLTLTALQPDTKYYFVVNSVDGSGNSSQSNEYSFTTLSPSSVTEPSGQKIKVYPNPHIKGKSSSEKITFANLPEEATIKIYNSGGELMKELSVGTDGKAEWDVSGVSGGVYLYVISSAEGAKKGKVSIIK